MGRLYRLVIIVGVLFFVIDYLFISCINASSLSVELLDLVSGASGASSVTFEDYEDAEESGPWVLADQYLYIEFDTDYSAGYWGLRIITDNMTDIVTSGDEPVGVEGEDEEMSYGGIIKVSLDDDGNITSVTDEPSERIILAWQAYNDISPLSTLTAPAVSNSDGDEIYEDDNVSTVWYEGDWAYVGDKSDDKIESAVVYTNDDGDTVVNYNVVAYGIGTYWFFRWLVPHPEDPDTAHTGDPEDRIIYDLDNEDEDHDGTTTDDGWDIYICLAGRFWNTGYFDFNHDGSYEAKYFQLPAGDYKTTIYIELFYE